MNLQQLKDKFGYQGFTENQWEWIKEKIDDSVALQKQRMVEVANQMAKVLPHIECRTGQKELCEQCWYYSNYNQALSDIKSQLQNL